jgi:hypothetical protein
MERKFEETRLDETQRDSLIISTFGFPYNPVDFQPTCDMSDAWEVVEKMTYMNPCVNWLDVPHEPAGWHACIDNHHVYGCDSAPEAICKAALKAMGVEIE